MLQPAAGTGGHDDCSLDRPWPIVSATTPRRRTLFKNRKFAKILQSIPGSGQPDRLHRLRLALAIVSQEAQLLREEITTEMKRLGLLATDDQGKNG